MTDRTLLTGAPGLTGASGRGQALLDRVGALLPGMAERAAALDATARFPAEDMKALADSGALAAPLPGLLGGMGAGTEPEGTWLIVALLRLLGRGSLPVARLFEAHVNALKLIVRFGSAEAVAQAAADVLAGHLFGLWVTDGPTDALRWEDGALRGRKGPASGAGHCSRALVTVAVPEGSRMAIIALDGSEPITPVAGLQGMRAAANGVIVLDGTPVLFWLGQPDDYMREPDFSCGAWRGSAAAAGGLDALVAAVGAGLRRRAQAEAPLQLERFGQMVIARETAGLWVARAAALAEDDHADPDERVAFVNLARIAVERACLDALRDAQRSLGLGAFVAPHPVERLTRDLGTYLRQPAPDEILISAAAWTLKRE